MVSRVQRTWERRERLVKIIASGLPLNEAVKALASEYECKQELIYDDWRNRKDWLPVILHLEKNEKSNQETVMELLAQLRESRSRLNEIALNADCSNAKVGAMNSLINAIEKEVVLRQSLGLLEKQPEKVQISGEQGLVIKMWRPDDDKQKSEGEGKDGDNNQVPAAQGTG